MGENHILKDNQWFVYDVKWPKLQNGKMLKSAGLLINDGNGDEFDFVEWKTQQRMLTPLWRSQIFMINCAVSGALAFVY